MSNKRTSYIPPRTFNYHPINMCRCTSYSNKTVNNFDMNFSGMSIFSIGLNLLNLFINPMSMGNQFGSTLPFNLFNPYTPIVPNNIQNPVIPDDLKKPTQPQDDNMGIKFDTWSKNAAQKLAKRETVEDFAFVGPEYAEDINTNGGKNASKIYLNGADGNGGIMKLSKDTIGLYDKYGQNNDGQISYDEYIKKEVSDYKDANPDDNEFNGDILVKIAEDTTKNYDGKTNYADFVQQEIDAYKKANPNVTLDDIAINEIKNDAINSKLAFDTLDSSDLNGSGYHDGKIDANEEAALYAAMDRNPDTNTINGKISQQGFHDIAVELGDAQCTKDVTDKLSTMYTLLFNPKK